MKLNEDRFPALRPHFPSKASSLESQLYCAISAGSLRLAPRFTPLTRLTDTGHARMATSDDLRVAATNAGSSRTAPLCRPLRSSTIAAQSTCGTESSTDILRARVFRRRAHAHSSTQRVRAAVLARMQHQGPKSLPQFCFHNFNSDLIGSEKDGEQHESSDSLLKNRSCEIYPENIKKSSFRSTLIICKSISRFLWHQVIHQSIQNDNTNCSM